MPKTLDSYLADRALTRQLYLMRFSAGEQKKVLAVLVDMRAELVAKLRAGDVTDFARGRLQKLLTQCEAVIDHGYGQIQTTLDFEGLAQVEAEATIRPLVAVGLEASIPTVATMKAVVNGSLIEGAKSADWWAKQSNDLAFKFAAQVRQGIAQNETMTQIVRRVAGSEKLGIPGIFEGARQNAFALVHTSVMQVAADARLATYRANSDIIKGVRQLSTMDSHTCWSPETKILMGDGSEKPIGAIVPGDVVIGGTTGSPCKVLAVEKNVVASSVETCYDGRKIGRAAHGHKILTRAGWREIESICLLPDIYQREVLCRRYREAPTQVAPTPITFGYGSGICAEQCVEEIRRPENDNPCGNVGPCSGVPARKAFHQDDENQGPTRIQHDGRRGGDRGKIGRIPEGIRGEMEETLRRGCALPGEDKILCGKSRAESLGSEQAILCNCGRAGAFEAEIGFKLASECCRSEKDADDARENEKNKRDSKGSLEGPGIPAESQFSEECKAGGTPGKRPTVGSEAKSREIEINEREMGGPCLSGKNEGPKACCCSEGITASRSRQNYEILDPRESCYPGGEDKITVCETESVFGKFITGRIVAEQTEIVSLSIEGDNSYVAGGIIVHNSPTCVAYSGAEWDLDGNPINGTTLPFNGGPPRHWGCRSVLTSITKTFKELGIKGLPELPDTGERASDLGPIDRKTTMDQFLRMHDKEWQDEMLGKGKAQLWRDGKITLQQLVSGEGRELSLAQLKALAAK